MVFRNTRQTMNLGPGGEGQAGGMRATAPIAKSLPNEMNQADAR